MRLLRMAAFTASSTRRAPVASDLSAVPFILELAPQNPYPPIDSSARAHRRSHVHIAQENNSPSPTRATQHRDHPHLVSGPGLGGAFVLRPVFGSSSFASPRDRTGCSNSNPFRSKQPAMYRQQEQRREQQGCSMFIAVLFVLVLLTNVKPPDQRHNGVRRAISNPSHICQMLTLAAQAPRHRPRHRHRHNTSRRLPYGTARGASCPAPVAFFGSIIFLAPRK